MIEVFIGITTIKSSGIAEAWSCVDHPQLRILCCVALLLLSHPLAHIALALSHHLCHMMDHPMGERSV